MFHTLHSVFSSHFTDETEAQKKTRQTTSDYMLVTEPRFKPELLTLKSILSTLQPPTAFSYSDLPRNQTSNLLTATNF